MVIVMKAILDSVFLAQRNIPPGKPGCFTPFCLRPNPNRLQNSARAYSRRSRTFFHPSKLCQPFAACSS